MKRVVRDLKLIEDWSESRTFIKLMENETMIDADRCSVITSEAISEMSKPSWQDDTADLLIVWRLSWKFWHLVDSYDRTTREALMRN